MIRRRSEKQSAVEVACPACRAVQDRFDGRDETLSCRECGVLLHPADGDDQGDEELRDEELRDEDQGPQRARLAAGSTVEVDGPPAVSEETVTEDGSSAAYRTVRLGWDEDTACLWREGSIVADRFRITDFVGQGGMGRVYLAQDETLKRSIAIKRIPQEILHDEDARDDLREEANRLLDLAHDHIVRVHTYYDGPTWPFIAMEFLAGPTLKRVLRDRKKNGETFSAEEVLIVARQVGAGLSHAHHHGIVHRDLKPANLMLAQPLEGPLTEACIVKITDFGISKVVAESTLRETGKWSGTLAYMSPEQYQGQPSTEQSDIYSLSCTLYELLSGKPPFYTGDVGHQILKVSPRRLRGRDIPKPMARTILRGLSKEPTDRFESVEQFVDSLEGTVHVPSPRFTRNVVSLGLKMVGGILFVLLVIYVASKRFGGGDPEVVKAGSAQREASVATGTIGSGIVPGRLTKFLEEDINGQLKIVGLPEGVPLGTPAETDAHLLLSRGRFPSEFLERLVLEYRLEDHAQGTKVKGIQSQGDEDEYVYDFSPLRHGTYELVAHVEVGTAGTRNVPFFRTTFEVDLQRPAFTVAPLEAAELVDPIDPRAPHTLATFHDVLYLGVVSSLDRLVGIEEVFYQQVVDDTAGIPWKVPKPERWEVRLPEPGEHTFRVYAVDKAGNPSEETTLRIRRYELSADSFRVGVKGNVAVVTGVLSFEGERPPDLRFQVNDEIVEASLTSPFGSDLTPTSANEFAFEARLKLPKATANWIELLYSWNGGRPRSLPIATISSNVAARAPEIFPDVIPSVTSDTEIALSGRVEPYFEGLTLSVEVERGMVSSKVTLSRPDETSRFATFEETVALLPDKRNRIEFVSFYGSHRLAVSDPVVMEIECDRTPPECTRAVLKRSSFGMEVDVEVSEPLDRLRGRVVMEGAAATKRMETLTLQSTDVRSGYGYRVSLADSFSPMCLLELEMLDRVGILGTSQVLIEKPSIARPPGGSEPVQRLSRSRFLKDMGMFFHPFGDDHLEVAVSETPAVAWKRFLGEAPDDEDLTFPMVLGDQPITRITAFVQWFQEQAADGYEYFVPTEGQWLCAFVDVGDPRQAAGRIESWFRDDFNSSPRTRYARNRVEPIGSRGENLTPTRLLDMESNVQEAVLLEDGDKFGVIGGHNRLDEIKIEPNCLAAREFDNDEQMMNAKVTGLRLFRRPAR